MKRYIYLYDCEGVEVARVEVDYRLIEALFELRGPVGRAVQQLLELGINPSTAAVETVMEELQTFLENPYTVFRDLGSARVNVHIEE